MVGLLIGPLVAAYLRSKDTKNDVDRQRNQRASRSRRRELIADRQAKRSRKAVTRGHQPMTTNDGIVLGHAYGWSPGPSAKTGKKMVLSWRDLAGQVLMFGSTGSGKTESALRIAVEAARNGYRVIFLDAKGSLSTARRFISLLAAAMIWPDQTGWTFFTGSVQELSLIHI